MEHKNLNTKETANSDLGAVIGSVSFPKGRPKCCGREMYPCGGVLGKRPDGKVGDVEHYWRCDICKSEVVDLFS